MSFRVWLDIDTGGPVPAIVAEVGTHTRSGASLWTDALDYPLHALDGQRAGDVCDDIGRAVDAMGETLSALPVGGGERFPIRDALLYLVAIREACEAHPNATIRVYR